MEIIKDFDKVEPKGMEDFNFKTLPIGYYIGRNVDASLEMTETSYYNFIQDKVVVSYLNIADMVKKIKNPDNLEKAIYNKIKIYQTPKGITSSIVISLLGLAIPLYCL